MARGTVLRRAHPRLCREGGLMRRDLLAQLNDARRERR
ncbi:MAG: hypothetical protein RIQ68_1778, partial [Pseudomonadota bacterium]